MRDENGYQASNYHFRKIPDDKPVDNAAVSRIYSQLSKEQSTYSTRAMRRKFLDR